MQGRTEEVLRHGSTTARGEAATMWATIRPSATS
jgi:hypothetical protein